MMNPIMAFVQSLLDEGLHPVAVRVSLRHPEAWLINVTLDDFASPSEGGDPRFKVDRKGIPEGVKLSGWERFADRTETVSGSREQVDAWMMDVARQGKATDTAWFDPTAETPVHGYPACLTKPNAWRRKVG